MPEVDGAGHEGGGAAIPASAPTRPRRWRDERGVASSIVLFPLFMVLVFMLVQAAWWQADRQAARAAADHVSSAIALYGGGDAAVAEGTGMMESAGLRDISISVARGGDLTVVDVSATAPGLLPGTSVEVHARSVSPTERPVGAFAGGGG